MIIFTGEGMGGMIALAILASGAVNPASTPFFPPKLAEPIIACEQEAPNGHPVIDELEKAWFSRHLAAAGEKPIWQGETGTVVRFTWLRSFHHPIIVRVNFGVGAVGKLTARELSGAGGYDPGVVARQIDRSLDERELSALRLVIDKAQLRKLLSRECRMGFDGAEWIIEEVDADGYHLVKRWSPDEGSVRDLGLAMLALTGWDVGEVY